MMAASSVVAAGLHVAFPEIVAPDPFEYAEKWVHLIGGIVGIMAGLSSVLWYTYSFIKGKRAKKDA